MKLGTLHRAMKEFEDIARVLSETYGIKLRMKAPHGTIRDHVLCFVASASRRRLELILELIYYDHGKCLVKLCLVPDHNVNRRSGVAFHGEDEAWYTDHQPVLPAGQTPSKESRMGEDDVVVEIMRMTGEFLK